MGEQTEKYEQTTEQTDIELLKEELEKAQRYLTMLSEEFTEKDIRMRKQKLIVGALAGMLAELDNEFCRNQSNLLFQNLKITTKEKNGLEIIKNGASGIKMNI